MLWESNSIIRYLASRYAGEALYPTDSIKRARVDQWLDWQATDLNRSWSYAFLGLVRKSSAHQASAGPLFLSAAGTPLLFTKRHTSVGKISYSCESLTAIYRHLHHQAGIEGGSASAARRTFAVHLRRNGVDLDTIRRLLGLSSLSAVKRIVDSDPVRLGAIVARVI